MKLCFGKYKDLEFNELIENQPNYCIWLLYASNSYLTKEMRALLTDAFPNKSEYYLTFGPLKGKSIQWVYKNEYDYIDHLKKNVYVLEHCKRLNSIIKELDDNKALN